MKIEYLKYFLTIAQTCSLHKTAEEHFLTPQNLSVMIKNLEEEVGEALFIRTSKGMQLTAEGENFLPFAQGIVVLYDEYFEQKKPIGKFLELYTTPSIANEITDLSKMLLNKYYLSIQKRSAAECIDMLEHKVKGIYLLMLQDEKIKKLKLREYTTILHSSNSYKICSKKNEKQFTNAISKKAMTIVQEHYDAINYGDCLSLSDVFQMKMFLRNEISVCYCLDYFYQLNFSEDEEWSVLEINEIPAYKMILIFNGLYSTDVKQSVEKILKAQLSK